MATPRRTAAGTTTGRINSAAPQESNTPKSAEVATPLTRRIETIYVDINDIAEYEWNPRNNEKAVASVAASIKAFGFLVPCVIDRNNVLIAGHTRVEASKLLGISEVPCIRATDLTPEQANAFRLIDNKVSEQAEWNFELLAGEMAKLDGLNLDFTEFGWSESEISCLQDLVSADCLNPANLTSATQEEQESQSARRSPLTARFVLGEITFFTTREQYRHWADGIRQLHSFNEDDIAADIRQRLGILT